MIFYSGLVEKILRRNAVGIFFSIVKNWNLVY